VCNAFGDLQVDILDGLASLLDKSLLRKNEGPEEEPRFNMLETIRQYALERLEARGEASELGRLHCEYYLALAELAMPELRGANQAEWLDRVEREHDNLRAALGRALGAGAVEAESKGEGGEADEAHAGVRIVAALWRFWWVRGHLTEWTRWTDLAMRRASDAPAEVQGRLYHGTGILADAHGDYTLAADLYRRSLDLKRRTGDLNGAAIMLNNLGHLALEQGDMKTAVPILEESLALQREIGDPWGVIFPLHNLATAALEQGDLARARELYEESLAMRRKSADVWSVAIGVQSMALVETRYGNYERAEQLYRESLSLQAELRSKSGVAGCLVGLAEVAQAKGQHERAALLLGVAQGVWDETGSRLSPGEEASLERAMGELRAAIGPEAVEREWAAGRAMPLERALSEL
jgi:tetratricopeptide (TPR) repeat protein